MLYDKRWDKTEVKTDPFTLPHFIAWLLTMPANKRYDYMNCEGKCLYGQYAASMGVPWKESGASSKEYGTPQRDAFCAFVYERIADPAPWTFGAALERARAAL